MKKPRSLIERKFRRISTNILCAFIPHRAYRKKIRHTFSGHSLSKKVKESALAHHYLDKLNGIEIGASSQNSFGLDRNGGAYATIDFDAHQGAEWQDPEFDPINVNIVSSGDDLPFKNDRLDYVLSSHVIEHFFDPIKALKEWIRVLKTGGYIFIIVPHKERTFDGNRKLTSLDELINRHDSTLNISDYCFMSDEEKTRQQQQTQGVSTSHNPHILIKNKEAPAGWVRFEKDDHHHWSVWTTESFLTLCDYLNLSVTQVQDPDDKVGNGFTVIIQK